MRKVSQGLIQAAKEMAKTAKEFRRVGTGVHEKVTGDKGQESYQVCQAIRALDGPNFVPVPCRYHSWAMQGAITKGQVSESSVLGFEGLVGLSRVGDFEDKFRACVRIEQKILIALAWKGGGRGLDAKQVTYEKLSLLLRKTRNHFSVGGHGWGDCVGKTLPWAGAQNEFPAVARILLDAVVLANVRSWAGQGNPFRGTYEGAWRTLYQKHLLEKSGGLAP